jgi:hypothetical protein
MLTAARLPGMEERMERLLCDLRALTVQLRAAADVPPPLRGALPAERERLRAQADFLEWECALLYDQLGRFRATGRADEEAGAGLVEPRPRPS